MPISFANPALLFGALASALPVIIHLISRRRVRRQPFSDLRFLDQVQTAQSRRLGIRRWLLLLLRVLAILFVALAVAQPRWGAVAASGRGARSVLFVIDASASMQTRHDGSDRFAKAAETVSRMIAALPGEASVQVLSAGATIEAVFGDWLPAGVAVQGGLRELACSDDGLDPAAVLLEAARLVSRAPGSPVEIVWIGDLQDQGETPGLPAAVERLHDAGPTRLLVRRVGETAVGGGILDLALPGRAVLPGENITLTATVTPAFAEEIFWLDLDGRTVAETVLETEFGTDSAAEGGMAPGAPRLIRFPLTVPGTGVHRGRIRKESDSFAADDAYPFVLKVPRALNVLLVHGGDRPVDGHAGRGGWRYLAQALDPGGRERAFRVRAVAGAELTTEALSNCDAAVFVNPEPLGRRAAAGLSRWLAAGGAALFLTGEPTRESYLEAAILPLLGLPSRAEWNAPAVSVSGGTPGQRVRVVDPDHPVFAGLEAAALQTFAEVRVRRWFSVQEGPQRVLLALTGEDPLLVEGSIERGHFALMPCDLLPGSTDLAANPMALPFFQRLAAWLANRSRLTDAVNARVGEAAVVSPRSPRAGSALENVGELMILAEGEPAGRTAELTWLGGEPVLSGGVIEKAGFVTFLAAGDTLGTVAAAVPAAESEPALRTVAEWSERLAAAGLTVTADLTEAAAGEWLGVLEGRDLAPWFLAAAIALLLLESVLGRGVRQSAGGTADA